MLSAAMDEFVRDVRTHSDIVSIVSSYVQLKYKSGRYWGCCPFHNEKTASFSVVPAEGFFYCFGCHVGGDVFKFISLIENITYFEAIKLQAEKLNILLPQKDVSPREAERDRRIKSLRKVHEMARDFFHNCLTVTGYGRQAKKYLAGRGITPEVIEDFKLGFAPNAWDKLRLSFQKRGVSDALLLAASLIVENKERGTCYDKFRNRLMIPIADEQGNVVAFGGRVLDDGLPKYLNSAETEIFNKRRLLFGLNRAKRAIHDAGYVILVEGYMDAISLHSCGIKNVVASLGTAFSADHCRLLLRYTNNFCFCYDSDAAGQKATVRALAIVRGTNANVSVMVVPDGKDPDEFVRKHGAAAFAELAKAALPAPEYRLRYVLQQRSYDTLEGKLAVLADMMPVLDGMMATMQTEYVKKLARILMVDEGLVLDELRRYEKAPHQETAPVVIASIPSRGGGNNDAVSLAGRILIRTAWRDASVLSHLKVALPPEYVTDGNQRRILSFLYALPDGNIPSTDEAMAVLDEAAAQELSRALVEVTEEGNVMEAYQDSLKILHRAHLNQAYMEHTRKASEYAQQGTGDYMAELNEAKRIKREMDELESDE